ncbi:hypothetical protein ABPG72_015576 [Tetrahymena utriculariae]
MGQCSCLCLKKKPRDQSYNYPVNSNTASKYYQQNQVGKIYQNSTSEGNVLTHSDIILDIDNKKDQIDIPSINQKCDLDKNQNYFNYENPIIQSQNVSKIAHSKQSKNGCIVDQNITSKADQNNYMRGDYFQNENYSFDIKDFQQTYQMRPPFINVYENQIGINLEQNDDEIYMSMFKNQNQTSALSFDNIYELEQKASIIRKIILIINQISQIYCISSGDALSLLRNKNYDFYYCFEFDQIQQDVKKMKQNGQTLSSQNNSSCLLCECDLNIENRYSLECEHYFCRTCFKEYMKSLLNLGNFMLQKTCPMDGCLDKIGWKEIQEFLREPQQIEQAQNILFNDYLQTSKNLKVCPLQNCERIFIFPEQIKQQINLRCDCETQFSCSSCQGEAHLPLNCEQYKKWMSLISSVDSKVVENLKYIMQNTKACPKCKVAVEKNGGCQHMKCQNCQSHFCWACLQITTNFSHPNFCKNEVTKQHESLEIIQQRRKEKYQQNYLYYKELAVLSQLDYVANITFFEDFISQFDRKEKDNLIKFRKQALNTLYEAKLVLAYSQPVGIFVEDLEKLSFLEYLQNNLESYLNKFEYHLTQQFREQFNDEMLASYIGNEQLNLKKFFYIYFEETSQFIEQLKNSLRNLLTQIEFDFPNQEIYNQNKQDLLYQDQIQNEIKNVRNQIKASNNQVNEIIKCSDCQIHLAENDFGLCQYCFETIISNQQ